MSVIFGAVSLIGLVLYRCCVLVSGSHRLTDLKDLQGMEAPEAELVEELALRELILKRRGGMVAHMDELVMEKMVVISETGQG